jgi:hypothetical protein
VTDNENTPAGTVNDWPVPGVVKLTVHVPDEHDGTGPAASAGVAPPASVSAPAAGTKATPRITQAR